MIRNKFIVENSLDLKKYSGIYADGAQSMSGSYREVQVLIRETLLNGVRTHCHHHREALASKSMSSELN